MSAEEARELGWRGVARVLAGPRLLQHGQQRAPAHHRGCRTWCWVPSGQQGAAGPPWLPPPDRSQLALDWALMTASSRVRGPGGLLPAEPGGSRRVRGPSGLLPAAPTGAPGFLAVAAGPRTGPFSSCPCPRGDRASQPRGGTQLRARRVPPGRPGSCRTNSRPAPSALPASPGSSFRLSPDTDIFLCSHSFCNKQLLQYFTSLNIIIYLNNRLPRTKP